MWVAPSNRLAGEWNKKQKGESLLAHMLNCSWLGKFFFFFAAATTWEHKTPASSAFECELTPATLKVASMPSASDWGCMVGPS